MRFYTEIGRFAFLSPLSGTCGNGPRTMIILGSLESAKWTSYYIIVLIKLFFARCYGWRAASEHRFKIGDFAPTGAGWPKILGRKGHPPPTILLLRKLG